MLPSETGVLYVVATPIGNLADLSQRACETLAGCDLVVSEDTRHTRRLLAHLGLDRPLHSYHKHSERAKAAGIVGLLLQGRSVALVSDAGVPVVSDPGAHLVALAAEHGVRVVPVPGPSAVLSALAVSGFSGDRFVFAGYAPRRSGERRLFYETIASASAPTVLFEAPHRVRESLQEAAEVLGQDRRVVVARELTKLHEEVLRGPLGELCRHFEQTEPIGEFTIVVSPADTRMADDGPAAGDLERAVALLAASGLRTKQAAEILAAATGLSRNEAYDRLVRADDDE